MGLVELVYKNAIFQRRKEGESKNITGPYRQSAKEYTGARCFVHKEPIIELPTAVNELAQAGILRGP